jgi:hypothetical protein
MSMGTVLVRSHAASMRYARSRVQACNLLPCNLLADHWLVCSSFYVQFLLRHDPTTCIDAARALGCCLVVCKLSICILARWNRLGCQ